jgi:predicted metal-dependent peptidase
VQRTKQTKKQRGMSRPSKMLSAVRKFAVLHEGSDDPRMLALQAQLRALRRVSVFPGTKHVNKFTIVFVVDTSGSMSAVEMAAGLAQLQHIQKVDRDVNICVIYADTHVCKEYWVGPNDELDTKMTGRGGTDFELVFRYVAETLMRSQDKAPDILVYCTDGYAPPPTTRLPIPTVWLLTPRGQPVMSEAGHITLEMRDYALGESY